MILELYIAGTLITCIVLSFHNEGCFRGDLVPCAFFHRKLLNRMITSLLWPIWVPLDVLYRLGVFGE